ncbi:glutathione S-transferase C-terminal domain-containing protein, partial [Streptomyces sp. NPDC058855]|uniref:glutathione S-transferase C-terminal domain-containing protein n=1 Tax=Streptomyces sp. NPDC058855 TaxID=3346651 RepID=UPI00367C59AB
LEDHLYWVILYYEFFDQQGFDYIISQTAGDTTLLPEEVQEAIRVRRDDFRKRCYDQGIARYTPEEVIAKANKDFDAISVILGENRFLLGDTPSSYDATLFGFIQAFFQAREMHPEITDYVRTIPNLGRYVKNIQETWYPRTRQGVP